MAQSIFFYIISVCIAVSWFSKWKLRVSCWYVSFKSFHFNAKPSLCDVFRIFNANANGIPRTSTPWQYLMVLIRKFQSTLKRYIRKTQYTRKRWRNFQLSGILCRNEMFACIFIFESYCLMHQRCFKKWNCESFIESFIETAKMKLLMP